MTTKQKTTSGDSMSGPLGVSNGMEATLYNDKATKAGTITLPENLFGLSWNGDLVHQVITALRANARSVLAHAKDRSEVAGGGKKPWQQKGTGRARHGSIRSPIWRHGGVTHGPRKDENYEQKVNRKMANKALATILSAKLKDKEVVFIDSLEISKPSTKTAQNLLNALSSVKEFGKINYKRGKRVLVVTPTLDRGVHKSFRNMQATLVEDVRNINPLQAATYKYVLFVDPKKSLESLSGRLSAK